MVREMPVKTKPYKHQLDAYNFAIKLPSSALLMEQGTGKTLSAIGVAGQRYLDGFVGHLLVVAPLSVLSEWERQFYEHAKFPFTIHLLEGKMDLRKQALSGHGEGLNVYIVNYDALKSLEKDLVKKRFDMIILDESQKIKNHTALRSRICQRLGDRIKYRMILTGTPVTKNPLDFYSQYRFLDKDIFGTRWAAFRGKYAIMGGWNNKQVVGYNNLDELVSKVHKIAFRVTKAEALDLPPFVDQVLRVKLNGRSTDLYKQMLEEAIISLKKGTVIAPIPLAKILRLQQITGGFIKVENEEGEKKLMRVSNAKLDLLEELIEDLVDQDKKIVVFARFIPEINAISKMLRKKKILYNVLTGKHTQPERKIALSKFQNNDRYKVFVAQIATGGVGITLTAADTMIFYSLDFSLGNYEQAKARIHRIGQHSSVTYIHILASNTLDVSTYRMLKQKRDLAKLVVDDWRTLLKEGESSEA